MHYESVFVKEERDFLYPEYCREATEQFVDTHSFILKYQTKEEAIARLLCNCKTTPRVELYALEGEKVCGHLFLCPGDDMHYGDVAEIRTIMSSNKEATRVLFKTAKGITKSLNVPYLCYTKWLKNGSYKTMFKEV